MALADQPRDNPFGPISDEELYRHAAEVPSLGLHRFANRILDGSFLNIYDISPAERETTAEQSLMVIRTLIREDDEFINVHGSEGLVRSNLLDADLLQGQLTHYYRGGKQHAHDVTGADQAIATRLDMQVLQVHGQRYPEVQMVTSLLTDLLPREQAIERGAKNRTAAGALLDLLRVYAASISQIKATQAAYLGEQAVPPDTMA